jgi:hypothetical protein
MLSQLACRGESLDPRTASSQLARRLPRILAEQRDNGEEFNIAWPRVARADGASWPPRRLNGGENNHKPVFIGSGT